MDYEHSQEEHKIHRERLLRRRIDLRQQRRRLDQELEGVSRELLGLDHMDRGADIALGRCESPPPRVPGLTEHIRKLLSETDVPLTAMQIRDSCETVGIRASSRRNLLIAVYTTLKRMHLDVKTATQNGRIVYSPRPRLRIALK